MNKNKGIISIGLIVGIILGVIVIGGVGYYLGKNSSKKEIINSNLNNNQIVSDITVSGNYSVINSDTVLFTIDNQVDFDKLKLINIQDDKIVKDFIIGGYNNGTNTNGDYKKDIETTKELNLNCSLSGHASITINTYQGQSEQSPAFANLVKVVTLSPDNKSCSESNVNTAKASTVTVDPKDPNISIYTSYNLGVQFSYLNNGNASFTSKPFESGDKISLDDSNYIRVFQKLSGESTEQAIKRLFPEIFQNNNCSVMEDGTNKYFIYDSRIPSAFYRSNYDAPEGFYGTPYAVYKNVCNPNASLDNDLIINPNFPNIIYYIEYSHQAFDYAADESKNSKPWFTTVHLIKK